MSSSPTPEEREKKDKADRAREAEEQAKLPYKWTQTIQDLDIQVTVPSNLRGKDINVVITKTHLTVGVKGQEPVIDVSKHTASNILNLTEYRAPSPTQSTPPNQPGPSKPSPPLPLKKYPSTSTKTTSLNGGHR